MTTFNDLPMRWEGFDEFNQQMTGDVMPTMRRDMPWQLIALTSSTAASPARTSPWPGAEPASPEDAPASSGTPSESSMLFNPEPYSWRTYPDCSPRTAVGTSESSSENWPTAGMAWRTGYSTRSISECPSGADACSCSPSLATILEPPQSVPQRYSLSAKAAAGILRRATKRGRTLPPELVEALESAASQTP